MTNSTIAQDLRIDKICTRFEEELKGDRSPRIELYLDDHSGEMKQRLLGELISLELWYARERNAPLSIVDYIERFPGHEAIVRNCFAQDALPTSPDPDRMRSTTDNSNMDSADSRWCAKNISIELPPRFGRYRILNRLGEGGMGNVYLAEDEALDRRIALKVPRLARGDGSGLLDRFRREAQAAARIVHPNLCPVYDIGEIDGVFYLTMAYIEGQSLAEHILQRRPINLHNTMFVIRKTAQALAEAHAQGVVHRDLKPSNIMINTRGEPVVVDFGLARTAVSEEARLTATGAIVGTPAYASPEQIESHAEVDPRTDIYSLGIILYELLTGVLPFQAGSPVMLLQRVLENDPPPPSTVRENIPKELDEICLKAISKRAEDRYQTMQELDDAIAAWEAKSGHVENSRPGWFQRTVIATPSQLNEATSKIEVAARVDSSQPVEADNRWTTRIKSRWQQNVSRIKAIRPRTEQTLWWSSCVILVICGAVAWSRLPGSNISALDNDDKSIVCSDCGLPGPGPEPPGPGPEPPGPGPEPPPGPGPVAPPPGPGKLDPPEFRVQLPVPVGGWTLLAGRLWHAGLDPEEPIRFNIQMRCVQEREDEEKRPFQVLEIDVTTLNNNHQEHASLLVDVEKYQSKKQLHIKEGWIFAPKDQVFARYDPNVDALAREYSIQSQAEKLPEVRLSVQDVLALLFKAETNVKTTVDKYRTMQADLRDERILNDQSLEVIPPAGGNGFTLIKTKQPPGEKRLPVSYSIEICEDVKKTPFSWGDAKIDYQPQGQLIFSATLTHEAGEIWQGNIAEFSPPEWDDPRATTPPRDEYAYLNLPPEAGASCQFEVNMQVPPLPTMKLNRVEVKVLNQEIVDKVTYRWIEVEVQAGGDFLPNKLVETVRLAVNEELYQKERKFEFLKDTTLLQHQAVAKLRVGQKPALYVRFDANVDRMAECYQATIVEHQKKIIQENPQHKLEMIHRLPIRNILSLMFNAELTPHLLKFNIRKHISFALTDARMRRYCIRDKMLPIPEEKDLACLLVHPGRSVSIVAGNSLPPTTLNYDIYISQQPEDFPFRWVDMELDLYEEQNDLPSNKIFGGRLKLRSFGMGAKSNVDLSVQEIVLSDPGEERAVGVIKNYKMAAERDVLLGKYSEAIERYETGLSTLLNHAEKEVSTALEVDRVKARIEELKNR